MTRATVVGEGVNRATIVGAGGYIGTHLIRTLRQQGWDCCAPVRDDPRLWEQDLGTVFYCAGLTADFRQRPLETVDAHVGLLTRLLRNARFDRLVYLSSTRVYAGGAGAAGTGEDEPLCVNVHQGDDLYKLSKLMGESAALFGGRDCVVARLSNVVGGSGNPHSFVYTLLQAARAGHIDLYSDPETAKDYIHIDDVCNLLIRLAQRTEHRLYNLASGVQLRHLDWIQRIQTLLPCSWRVSSDAPKIDWLPIQTERIRHEFSFEPRPALLALSHGDDWLKGPPA